MAAKKILVIEDDLSFLKTICNVLKVEGYLAILANSGGEGIQKAYEHAPDLILCDVTMQPIDGYQTFKILQESSLTKRIPFIFITGRSTLNDIRFGLDLGADDYIVKPFQNEDLVKSIQTRLEKYEYLINVGRSKYETFIEYSPNGIFLFDESTIYEANKAFRRILGADIEDICSGCFRDIVLAQNKKSFDENISRCMRGVINSFQEKVMIRNVDGINEKYILHAAPSIKYNGFSLLTGLLVHVKEDTSQSSQIAVRKLVNILKEEDIRVTNHLLGKLNEEFNNRRQKKKRETGNVITSEIEFSTREMEVLELSCQGLPMKAIAEELCISGRTVESHRASLMEKTSSKNIVELIIYAIKEDLIKI